MHLYHGSTVIVDKPIILQKQRTLDFGSGFYTTTHWEQAVRWAEKVKERRQTKECFISVYEFDLDQAEEELNILRFEKPNKEWLDFVCSCRKGKPFHNEKSLKFCQFLEANKLE